MNRAELVSRLVSAGGDAERAALLAAHPALADVRAVAFLADGVDRRAVDQPLDVEVVRVRARGETLHPLRAARTFSDWL